MPFPNIFNRKESKKETKSHKKTAKSKKLDKIDTKKQADPKDQVKKPANNQITSNDLVNNFENWKLFPNNEEFKMNTVNERIDNSNTDPTETLAFQPNPTNIYESLYLPEYEFNQLNTEPDLSGVLLNSNVKDFMRAKMVDWMMEVLDHFYNDKTNEIFFRAVNLMDYYIKNSMLVRKTKLEDNEVHLVGTTCIFISSKLEQVYHISLEDTEEKVAHNCFSQYTH